VRRKRLSPTLSVGMLVLSSILVLTGCAASPTPQGATGTQTLTPTSTPTGTSLQDPREIRGASTAANVNEVIPITTSAKPKLPVTVTDESGASVTITDASRILALDVYGTLAETVVGLGLGDALIGRGASNTLASMADLPLVTQNGHDLNGEAILSLAPTLILTDTTVGPAEVQQQLIASGIPVVFFSPDRSIGLISGQVKTVAATLGLTAEGTKLATRIEQEVADATTAIAAMAPADPAARLRIAFLYVRGNAGVFFVFGKGMGADDLITGIGGIDVATEAGITGAKPANSESLLLTNPDLFLVMTDGLESTGGVDGLLARPGVGDTTAGQNRRIVDMSDGQILSFGPSIAGVLTSLATAIYAPTELH
jgi:iron complex transport system substrate-binding protein